ncbi:NAD(P)-binding domain-containing protein [Oceanispirochaeta sp.]
MSIKNIAWIGTGVMGRSMCLHLMERVLEPRGFIRSSNP